jgi:hypothetical protein
VPSQQQEPITRPESPQVLQPATVGTNGDEVTRMNEGNAVDLVLQDEVPPHEMKRRKVLAEVEKLVKRELTDLENNDSPKWKRSPYQPHHLNVDAMLAKVRI